MTKTERIFVRVSKADKERIQAAAAEDHRTVSNYIENVLQKALRERDNAMAAIAACENAKITADGDSQARKEM